MRVGVVDIGTNSTRLLVADVDGDHLEEVDRRSIVTRLGTGVDATARLNDEAMARVHAVLADYRAAIDGLGCQATTAVLTSAVRDAANGAEFTAQVRERHGLDARTINGDEEAQLTFLGATSERPPAPDGGRLLVVDIGGGSTELVVGAGHEVAFHVSTQAGVVRQTERHVHSDPPRADELDALAHDVHATFDAAVPAEQRSAVAQAVAVAGTATTSAAIDLGLEPYDPSRVEGHSLSRERLAEIGERLAVLPLAERREVAGLHPDRAPTIVAGVLILLEVLEAFGLPSVEVSEHDILRGAALRRARSA